jgi:hypothetical protein
MSLVRVELSINSAGEILCNLPDQEVKKGDIVEFWTNNSNLVFALKINNADGFFTESNQEILDLVSISSNSSLTVNDPTMGEKPTLDKVYNVTIYQYIGGHKVPPKLILRP